MIFDQFLQSLKKNLQNYSVINERLASGKRINKPSDDVIGLMRSMDYRVIIASNDQYDRNISEATAQLTFANTTMTSISDAIQKAKAAAQSSASGDQSPDTTASLVQQTAQLRDQLLSLGNSVFRDRFIFSGFRTNQPAFDSLTYAYQGDAGVINAPIDRTVSVPVNVPGSGVFAYTLGAPDVVQISGGRYVHYTPGAGTTVQVEIRDTDDATVLDTFSFSNVIQMTDTLSSAISSGTTARIEALMKPFNAVLNQTITVQAEIGTRLAQLDDQTARLTAATNTVKTTLNDTEAADPTETAVELQKAQVSLQALRESATKIISQSLMDFLE